LWIITVSVAVMNKATNFRRVGAVTDGILNVTVYYGDMTDKHGDVYKDGSIKLVITNVITNIQKKKVFHGEMAHWDGERWLNDIVGYPNPFAGILTTGKFVTS
jgi:hypothetical protein